MPLDSVLPLSIDPRFENQLNMRYLPPMVSTPSGYVNIRSFNKWTDSEGTSESYPTLENLQVKIQEIKQSAVGVTVGDNPVQPKRITIGSLESDHFERYNILGQVFVKKKQSLKKYVIIDAGEFFDVENQPVCRIYFMGFVYKDQFGVTKFAREFSFIFHNGTIDEEVSQ